MSVPRPRARTIGPRTGRDRQDRAVRGWTRRGRAAYETLAAVHRDDGYANLVLPRLLAERRLAGRDAAFATELAYGTLRLGGSLDAVIAAAADRAVDRIDPPARDALRLGAYQLLHMRVPPHAATSTTVDLVRAVAPGAAGFANAVLRRIGRAGLGGMGRGAGARPSRPRGWRSSTPIRRGWCGRSPTRWAVTRRPTSSSRCSSPTTRPRRCTCAPARAGSAPPTWPTQTGGTAGPYGPYAVHLPAGSPGEHAAVAHGLAHVQDEGSPARRGRAGGRPPLGRARDRTRVARSVRRPRRQGRAARRARGAARRAGDRGGDRAAPGPAGRARGAVPAGRRGVRRRPRGRPTGADLFDRVLVDAPCTGLGALRRRPEARWRRQPGDLPPLTRLQRELLAAALRLTRPGGLVAYVTCSPHVAETRVTVTETCRRFAGRRRAGRRAAAAAAASPTWATARRCSSGRTGTAPTPCSSPCSAD